MSLWKQTNRILLTCPKGVTKFLKSEVENLGFPILREIDTGLQTEGTLEDTMLFNLHLRTAQRVLYQLQTFKATSPGELYKNINSIDWENIFYHSGKSAYICVTSVVDNTFISDSRFANLKAKDAIVDRIRDKCSNRPDSGPERNRAVVHAYWKNDQVIIYLDTSGERLSLRGYRKIPFLAPMQETLAAAVIMATRWNGNTAFINPMCGSGTLAIEAALIALDRAPGLLRNNFGFMHIKGYPENLWRVLQKNAHSKTKKSFHAKIIATDINKLALQAAQHNAKTSGVNHIIEFHECSFENTPLPKGKGIIIVNPPYGERMDATELKYKSNKNKKLARNGKTFIIRKADSKEDKSGKAAAFDRLKTTYKDIGNFFKNIGKQGNWYGYIFTGNLAMVKSVGLRTKKRLIFYNGDIECRLLEYELYADTRKLDRKKY